MCQTIHILLILAENTFYDTDWLWSNILVGTLAQMKLFTIKMEIAPMTELKILRL